VFCYEFLIIPGPVFDMKRIAMVMARTRFKKKNETAHA